MTIPIILIVAAVVVVLAILGYSRGYGHRDVHHH
jgi:hypothetical protein